MNIFNKLFIFDYRINIIYYYINYTHLKIQAVDKKKIKIFIK